MVWHDPIGGLEVAPLFIGNKVLLIVRMGHAPHVYKTPANKPDSPQTVHL